MTENTQDLSKLGYREIEILSDLLKAYLNDTVLLGDGVKWEFNPNSGNVFLVDDDYNVAMLNGDGKLENFITCSYCGKEGFKSELTLDDENNCADCKGK